jgi:hypothetical protein
MKTLIAIMLSLGSGAAVGAAVVVGVQTVADPDRGVVEETSQGTPNVMVYGDRS